MRLKILIILNLLIVPIIGLAIKVSPYIGIEIIESALKNYKTDCGRFPSSELGLHSLLVLDMDCWKGPYLKKSSLVDFYENNYLYKLNNGSEVDFEYFLSSAGKDEKFGTKDDINNFDSKEKRKKILEKLGSDNNSLPIVSYILIYILVVFLIFAVLSLLSKKKISE